jgi:hypothetical protein
MNLLALDPKFEFRALHFELANVFEPLSFLDLNP